MLDPTKHNYYKKVLELFAAGKIPSKSITDVDIFHDDWCGIHKGGYCDCDPDVKARAPRVQHGGNGAGKRKS